MPNTDNGLIGATPSTEVPRYAGKGTFARIADIHEVGDCSSDDGMSTKGHFNPLSKPHAHYSTSERHAGDMPALKADANGNAHLDTTLDVMTVNPGPASIIGRGLIVHAGSDDYKTQPTGNAGPRIACAVIRKS